jgi:TPR repeat protein
MITPTRKDHKDSRSRSHLDNQQELTFHHPGRFTVNELYWQGEPDLTALHDAHGLLATDPQRAITKLTDLAERGSLMSMVYLAEACKSGAGTSVDAERAEEWYERAARGGSVLATYHLGRIYLNRMDFPRAEEAFRAGENKGYMPSAHQLGRMLAGGIGVPKNVNAGREHLERASRGGYVFAKRDLALLLLSGQFGVLAALRGAWLFMVSMKDLIVEIFTDPTRERLR